MKLNRTHATRWQPRHVLKHAIPIPLGERARSADGDNDDGGMSSTTCIAYDRLSRFGYGHLITILSGRLRSLSLWDIITHNEHEQP